MSHLAKRCVAHGDLIRADGPDLLRRVLGAAALVTLAACATPPTSAPAPSPVTRAPGQSAGQPSASPQAATVTFPAAQEYPPTARRHDLIGTLGVYVDGDYPKGYGPKWAFVGGDKRITMRVENFVVRRPLTDQAAASISLRNIDGNPTLVFSIEGLACMASLAPAGPAVISAQPMQFQLVNFRRSGNTPCATASNYSRSWSGRMSMSSSLNGDINLQLTIESFSDRGQLSYRYSWTATEPNQMTPALALEAVRRDAQLAAQREAKAKADLEARKLPAADLTALPAKPIAGDKLQVVMKAIDDVGLLFLRTPDGNWKLLGAAEWSVKTGPGSATVSIKDELQVGNNIVVFAVHNKAFVFGEGKWSFDITLSADAQTIWTKSSATLGGGVGIRYWKAFVVNKAAKGTLSVVAANSATTQAAVPKVEELNAWLQKHYGTENSVATMLMDGLVQSMFAPPSSESRKTGCPEGWTPYESRFSVGCIDPRGFKIPGRSN